MALGLVGTLVAALALTSCRQAPARADSLPSAQLSSGMALSEPARRFLVVEAVDALHPAQGAPLPGRLAFQSQAVSGVGTPVAGRITAVLVRPGEAVRAGQPLVTLQSAEAAACRAALAQAQAATTAAEAASRRQAEMVTRGVGLEVERTEAEARAQQARAELARARQSVALLGPGTGDRVELRAPTPGAVVDVDARPGAVVEAGGGPLVEVGDPGRLWVVADVPEGQAGGLAVGQQAEVEVPASAKRLQATIDGLGPRVDAETRRIPVYLSLRGGTRGLRAGMQAEVRVSAPATARVLTLPATAVLIKEGDRRVVYVEGPQGRFLAREVQTGASRGGRVVIREGLSPGERVVVRGALLLDGEAEQQL